MCTNFYGSVFTAENLCSIAPEYSIPHFGQTRWSRLRFVLDKKPRVYWQEGKNHTKSLSNHFQCIYHFAYYSNGLHATTPCSRVLFGKSIAAAFFKKYVGPCSNKVLSSVPGRPVVGPDSYLFLSRPYLHNSLLSTAIPVLFSHPFRHWKDSQHFKLVCLMPHR